MKMPTMLAAVGLATMLIGCGGPEDDATLPEMDSPPTSDLQQPTRVWDMTFGEVRQQRRANGDCCYGACKNGTTWYNEPLTSGCASYMAGWCASRGGLADAWWAMC